MQLRRAWILGLVFVACSSEDKEGTESDTPAVTMTMTMTTPMGMTEVLTGVTDAPTTGSSEGPSGSTSAAGSTSGPPGETGDDTTSGGTNNTGNTTASNDPVGNCCTPHDNPGCTNSDIQACVCGFDLNCCSPTGGGWDDVCVIEVGSSGCAVCPMMP